MELTTKKQRKWLFQLSVFFPPLLAVVGAALVIALGWQTTTENKLLDFRFQLRGDVPTDSSLIIVDIADDAMQEFGSWPFPRQVHGMFIDAASQLGVQALLYDVSFVGANESNSDQFLLQMSQEAGFTHFPLRFSPYEDAVTLPNSPFQGVLKHGYGLNQVRANGVIRPDLKMRGLLTEPLEGLDLASAGMGFVNIFEDPDGVIRRTPPFLECNQFLFPQLGMSIWLRLMHLQAKDLTMDSYQLSLPNGKNVPLDGNGNLILNWPGRYETLPHYSFREIILSYKQVMEGLEPLLPMDSLKHLRGKILLIGRVGQNSTDFVNTPLQSRHPAIGLHMAVLQTLLSGNYIRVLSGLQHWLLILALVIVVSLLLYRDTLGWQVGVLLFLTLYLLTTQFVFIVFHYHLPIFLPTLLGIGLLVWHNVSRYAQERVIKKKVQGMFAKYVTQEVMNQLLEKPELTKVGGRKEQVTVLFSDIRGFTSISETHEATEVVEQLNEYLALMTPIVFSNHGIIDKFVGDEIMAYYGAPVYPEEHAWRAVKTAMEMQEALSTLRIKWAEQGKPDIQIGIGINTGPVIMGNIGSEQYMDFTLIGDNVNLGARLCSLAGPGEILVSSSTYREIVKKVIVGHSKELAVKGKAKPVRVYSITGLLSLEGNDRRGSMRHNVSWPARIFCPNGVDSESVLANISLGGLYCNTMILAKTGDSIEISIELPNGIVMEKLKSHILEVSDGQPPWTIRVRFEGMPEADHEELSKWLTTRNPT
jgi:adenylate cyclase